MECLGRKYLQEELKRNEILVLLLRSRVQGESTWQKTGVVDRSRVHVMSNGAGRVIDSGDNQLSKCFS